MAWPMSSRFSSAPRGEAPGAKRIKDIKEPMQVEHIKYFKDFKDMR